jgi:hypothetical protein
VWIYTAFHYSQGAANQALWQLADWVKMQWRHMSASVMHRMCHSTTVRVLAMCVMLGTDMP